jgi:hypothetical protein
MATVMERFGVATKCGEAPSFQPIAGTRNRFELPARAPHMTSLFFSPLRLACAAALCLPAAARSAPAADLPPPSPDNTFYVYAIWDPIMKASEDQIRTQMDEMLREFGPGNAYHRPGVAFIFPGVKQTELICKVAKEKGMAVGVILGTQTHSDKAILPELAKDLRSIQWRMDPKYWGGYFNSTNNAGKAEISEDSRDHWVATPSRYCDLVRRRLEGFHRAESRELKQVMDDFPGVVTVVNAVIEEELAIGASSVPAALSDALLADYSPYAVTEFRDWLRHTGQYDADTGKHAGEGAPEAIVGPFVEIKGKLRSPFYDDPDPSDANGTGRSFNEKFGTAFKTWTLKYWDLEVFPAPITDTHFNPGPEAGEGFTDGGFDAPRHRDNSPWWTAWSWDYDDRGQTYPPGNPAHPAFGFRQCLVKHFVEDIFNDMAQEGLPKNEFFAHQIPGEAVGAARCRSSASPVWTGYLELNGSVGITQFGPTDVARLTQYSNLQPNSPGWGIFEWHPLYKAAPQDQELYDIALRDLLNYYQNGCHHLFAGWWQTKDTDKIFHLQNSMFSKAIHDFLATRPDKPFPGALPKAERADKATIR